MWQLEVVNACAGIITKRKPIIQMLSGMFALPGLFQTTQHEGTFDGHERITAPCGL